LGHTWACAAGQDARLYDRRDARRYAKRATELISRGFFASADVIE